MKMNTKSRKKIKKCFQFSEKTVKNVRKYRDIRYVTTERKKLISVTAKFS